MFSSLGFLKKLRAWLGHFRRKKVEKNNSSHDLKLLRNLSKRHLPEWRQVFYIKKILSPIEKIIFNISLLGLLVGAIWFGFLFVDKYRVEVPKISGFYIEGVVGSIQTINPVFAPINDADMDVTRLVYSGLMRYDKEQRLMPDLVANYQISEDKKVYTFELRKDVLWHDMEPFKASDVVFTFETIQDEKVGSPLYVGFRDIKVEAVGDYTVKFTLREPFRSFLSSLTIGILPEHLWHDVPLDQMKLAQRNFQPIGTGPFKFKRLIKNDAGYIYRCELERFAEYYRQSSFIKEFIFQFFTNYDGPDGAIYAVREQKIDGLGFVPVELIDKVKRKHINLLTLQMPQYTALFFNQSRNSALESKELRTALRFALDKDRILHNTVNGNGKVINNLVLPGFHGYDEKAYNYQYSVEEANKLLDKNWPRETVDEYSKKLREKIKNERIDALKLEKEAEIVSASSSTVTSTLEIILTPEQEKEIDLLLESKINPAQLFYRRNKDGEMLEIELVTSDIGEYRLAAQSVVAYWAEIGVVANIRFVDPRDLSRRVLKTRDYDVLLYGIILGGDHDQYAFWHSSQIDYPGLNLSRFSKRDADSILEKIRNAVNDEELNNLYKELQNLINEDVPAIFLYTPTYTYVLSDKIKGFDVNKIGQPADRFSNIIEWYIGTKNVWKTNFGR